MKDQFREATARSILDAAERAFAAEGVEGARMESIAAGAGVAVGTVYNYFEDREALLVALIQARRDALFEALDRDLAQPPGRPWAAQLEGFLGAFLGHVETHREFFTIVFQGDHAGLRAHKHTHASVEEIRRRFEEVVQRGLREGALRPEQSELYAPVLMGMCRAVALHTLRRKDPDVAARAGALAALFLRGAGVER